MPLEFKKAHHSPQSSPKFVVAWERRGRNFWSSYRAVFREPKPIVKWPSAPIFHNGWVKPGFPRRAMLASVLWHIILINLTIPLGRLSQPKTNLLPPRIEVTWYGSAQDLSPIIAPGPIARPSPPGKLGKRLPPPGAKAYHPRETVLSVPEKSTHPRQTLIQPATPQEPPKILPDLPNIVAWNRPRQPKRPRLPISPEVLAQFHPKETPARRRSQPAIPEVPNQEKRPGNLNIASSQALNPAPRMPVNPSSLAAPSARRVATQAAPAPDLEAGIASDDTGLKPLIALSASPSSGPPPPIPPGNVSATLTLSPQGIQPGVPGGVPGGAENSNGGVGGSADSPGGMNDAAGAGAKGPPGVTISANNPNGSGSGLGPGAGSGSGSGPGDSRTTVPPLASPLPSKPEPRPAPMVSHRAPPADALGDVRPDQEAQEILGSKRVYTLVINMPNLTSAAGSWVLNFAEMDGGDIPRASEGGAENLVGPLPLRKVDPRYPPELISQRVEGEVVLYAIIRSNGTVDSIHVVKGVDPQLDQNAMEAFSRWKFRPALRDGQPVDLEAVVRIPFRAVAHF